MRYRVLLGVLLLLLATAALAACGSTAASATTVQVTLTDTGVQASQTSFTAGRSYQFLVKNGGTVAHAFVLMPYGMQTMPIGQMQQQAMLWTSSIAPGQSLSPTYTFSMSMALGSMYLGCYSQEYGMLWQSAWVQ
jgi:ABC-type glycerol-3-phosphate transport system substrate-binding protein